MRMPTFQDLKRWILGGLITMAFATGSHAAIAQIRASEADLKAAIITNMAIFVEWPVSGKLATNDLKICIFGNSPVGAALTNADGKSIGNRQVQVVTASKEQLGACHVVYVTEEDKKRLPEIMNLLGSTSALLASDSPQMLEGVMINLEQNAGRIVFDVNLRAVRKAGIKISSKALRLARTVIE